MSSSIETAYVIHQTGHICGMDILEADWRFSFATLATCFVLSIFKVLSVYSIYMFRTDYFHVIETICCYGITIPGAFKLYLALSKKKELRALWQFPEQVYASNYVGSRAAILARCAARTRLIIKVFAVLFISSFLLFSAMPIHDFFAYRKLTLFLAVNIPFVDPKSYAGFAANIAMQLVMAVYAAAGHMTFDLLLTLIISNYSAVVSVLAMQLKSFAQMYKRNVKIKKRRQFLRNLLIQFNDVNNFINTLNDIFSGAIFVQIAASSFSITLALFSIVANDWVSGYGYVLYSFGQIFIYSYMGTIIQNEKTKLCDLVYDTPWYLYEQRDKKMILALLQMCQNFTELWIGPLAPLNVETGSNIVRSIYRYYTIMVSFLE